MNSRDYVWAVTFDEGDYINNFWADGFTQLYLNTNLHKKDIIERIFVLEEETINGKNREKHQIIKEIISFHKKIGLNFQIVSKKDLPLSWKNRNSSILICDDVVIGESYSFNGNVHSPGYISFISRKKITEAKNAFEDLKACPKSNLNDFNSPS